MKEKQRPEEMEQWETWYQPTYRTGGTQPPKSHGGLIAFLLVLVIFLCGVSTALGLMNVRLFRQLSDQLEQEDTPVVFSYTAEEEDAAEASFPLGLQGQPVSDFWQNYHHLPQGIYITEVCPDSIVNNHGIQPGDILVAFNGEEVSDLQILQQLLDALSPDSPITLHVYRDGQYSEITLP
jgi:membrane-associated protease RseP (regulator of RpoE activity)